MGPFGYQWFSLQDRSPETLLSELERVYNTVNSYIESKMQEFGLKEKDIILVGFSQGTMTALNIGLKRDKPFACIIGFSGALIHNGNMDDILHKKTPICLIHGEDDEVLHYDNMLNALQIFKKEGFEVEAYGIPNLQHSINAEGIKYAIDFIKKYI